MKLLTKISLLSTLCFLSACASSRNLRTEVEEAALIHALSAYKAKYGKYPEGSNKDMLDSLQGKPTGKFMFFELNPKASDPSGQFLDPWGTAYAFESPTKRIIIVRSAGKDRALFTTDDITKSSK